MLHLSGALSYARGLELQASGMTEPVPVCQELDMHKHTNSILQNGVI